MYDALGVPCDACVYKCFPPAIVECLEGENVVM
jgi:hypothetical protein